jgi:hypothetical protein
MLLFFNSPECPPGWNEVTAAEGRYLVALPENGAAGGVTGIQLSDQENRPVGQHMHSISDPGHTHSRYRRIAVTLFGHNPATKFGHTASEVYQTSINTTGITINNAGSVVGTNAPYTQLLLCEHTGALTDDAAANIKQKGQASSADKLQEGEFPPGSVMYFNAANCPPGWEEQIALQGRYAVGLPSGGVLGATVGTALSDQENRPIGQHAHNINDPGHFHTDSRTYAIASDPKIYNGSLFLCSSQGTCTTSFTGITIQDADSIDGTNAPYIQLLACQPVVTAPGKVLNNLIVNKSNGNPVLNWEAVGGTCNATYYGIYRGTLPFSTYDHASLDCMVSATTYTDTLANDSYYYLVVPNNSSEEGFYGAASSGTERPQGSSPCNTQNLTICN